MPDKIGAIDGQPDGAQGMREVRYECSSRFVPILVHLGATLLVSIYQAGKLVALSVRQGKLGLSFINFDRPMGVAVHQAGIILALAWRAGG